MIYAPIKYKKVNVSSPLYLQCLSYNVAPASVKDRYVKYDNVEVEEAKTSTEKTTVDGNDKPISKTETTNFDPISKDSEVSPAENEKQEVKPVCKQTAREKLKQFSATFSQKIDALLSKKSNTTKEVKRADLSNEVTETELHETKNEKSRTQKLKEKFYGLLSRDKENQTEQSESAFTRFKTKVKNMLSKNEKTNETNEVVDETLKQMALGVLSAHLDNNDEVDETFAAIAQSIQEEKEQKDFDDISKTLQQMALGVLPNSYDNVKIDNNLAVIAQNIQEEQSQKEFEEIDETFVAMSKAAKKEQALEEKEAIRLANGSKTDTACKNQPTSEDASPASALDDIAEIGENILANSQPKTKDTLSQKLGRSAAKIKEFFARKNKNEAVVTQNTADDVITAENNVQNNENKQVVVPQTSENEITTAMQEDVAIENNVNTTEIDNATDETAKTTRKVACQTEDNGTYKRKSYYALKVENAKKHIVNAGIRIKSAAKRFVCFFKDKFTEAEAVDNEDKDDYRKYGMKETFIADYPETTTETTTSSVETPTQNKTKTYKTTTLDYFFDL